MSADRRMPPCATCGHGWPMHVIPGGVENIDIYPTTRECVEDDCRCRNYVKEPAPSASPAAGARLSERLLAIIEYKRAWKADPTAQFDRLAEQFYRETGMMAPGKSVPLEMSSLHDEMPRKRAWDAFLQRLSDERDAALREAATALSPGPSGLAASLESLVREMNHKANRRTCPTYWADRIENLLAAEGRAREQTS